MEGRTVAARPGDVLQSRRGSRDDGRGRRRLSPHVTSAAGPTPSIRATPARPKGACGVAARWPPATLGPHLRRALVVRYGSVAQPVHARR